MPKVWTNGIQLHYQSRGEGPDIVLIHGVTSNLAVWYNGVLPVLSSEFRVTVYDLRGHGLSDLTPNGYTSRDMSEDLLGLFDSLAIQSAVLVGHSFGGAIALHFALLYPERVRGVAMLDSGLACMRYLRIIQDWSGWENRPADMKERGLTMERFLELDSEQDATAIIRHGVSVPRRAGFKKGQDGMTPRLQKLLDETRLGYEFRDVAGMTEERLRSVRTPVLAAYGETSPYKKMATRLAEILPACRYVVLPGLGHFYAVHYPQSVVETILPFLRDPAGYTSPASRPRTELKAVL